jgi:CHAD domain-containing protein
VLAEGTRVLPPTIVEHSRQRFAWLGEITSPARDLDVQLLEWSANTGGLDPAVVAALEPVRALLELHRDEAYLVLAATLRSRDADELISSWRFWLHDPMAESVAGAHGATPLGVVVARRITRAQSNLLRKGRLIRVETPAEQVHDLRKDAKRLRYLFECFGSLLPEGPQRAFVRRLKAFQENLGEHQDAEVHVARLRSLTYELHEAGASTDTVLAVGQLTERLDQRRIAARAAFAERFAAYDGKATERALAAALDGLAR